MPSLSSSTPSKLMMVEKSVVKKHHHHRIRPFKPSSDATLVFDWFREAGWRGFSWTTWMLASEISSYRQWVAVNEFDRPVSYIAIGQQSWGQFVAGYITAKKYRGQGVGSVLWQETVGKLMEKNENVGLTSDPDMVRKYAIRSNLKHISPVELITFKGRINFLDGLKTLPKGLFNPRFKVYQIQDDRAIEKVIAYDRKIFSSPTISTKSKNNDEHHEIREEFLWTWLRRGRMTRWDPAPRILSLYAENTSNGAVVGFGSISEAGTRGTVKLAPIYANDDEIARTLMTELIKFYNCTVAPIDQILIQVPGDETRGEFMRFLGDCGLINSLTMQQAFTRRVPRVNYDRVYCIAAQFCQLY